MRLKGLSDIKTHSALARSRGRSGRKAMHFKERIRLHLIEAIRDLLDEFQEAFDEGLPVAISELKRLKARLADLQSGFPAGR